MSIVSVLLQLQVDSDSEEKMGDELTILLEAFHKIEKAGGQARPYHLTRSFLIPAV